MKSFVYDVPTKVYFGPNQLDKLGEEISKYGKRVFFIHGKHIYDNGIYDAAMKAAKDYDLTITEFMKVKPNPRHTDVQEGVDLCRANNCDVILVAGGGSAIDSSKVIASGVYIDAPVWDVVLGKYPVTRSLPIITICTVAATGSEMNFGAVISNLETQDKQSLRRPSQRPKVTFLNPEFTYSVNQYQTACGTMDILCHTLESYFSSDDCLHLLDTFMEGIVNTVFKYGPVAFNDPENYEARANLMWAAPWAINELTRADKEQSWIIHPIEHELSAYYDITHGLGLSILMPRYFRHILDEKSLKRFKNLAVRAFDFDAGLSDEEAAEKVIQAIEDLAFNKFGLTNNLTDLGIDDSKFELMASKVATDNGYFTTGYRRLSQQDIVDILKDCL